MEVYRHAFGGAAPAGAAGGGAKNALAPACLPGFARAGPLPKTKAFKRRRANGPVRRNSASAVPLRLPPFCRRPLCRARARHRARMRCPVTGAKRRCATKAARPVPAGCSQGMFLFRPASAFSAPGGSLCAGSWEKNVSCSKQFGLLHRSDVGSTLVPPRPFVNYLLSVSSHFLQKTCANCKILCSLNFSLRKKQKQGVLAHAIAPPTPPRPVPFRRARAKRRPSAAILRF